MSATGDVWSSFDHDPRLPANAPLRAADRDRDVIRTALATAYAEGRLDREEFDERSEQVTSARTLGELPPIIADLVPDRSIERHSSSLVGASPQELRRRAELHWQAERRNAVVGVFGASLVTWAIWLATSWSDGDFDPYFPWPLIVMALSLANLIRTVATKADSIEEGVRYLEKKQAKQLRSKRSEE